MLCWITQRQILVCSVHNNGCMYLKPCSGPYAPGTWGLYFCIGSVMHIQTSPQHVDPLNVWVLKSCSGSGPRRLADQRRASASQPCLLVTWDLVGEASRFLLFLSVFLCVCVLACMCFFEEEWTYTANYCVTATTPLRSLDYELLSSLLSLWS